MADPRAVIDIGSNTVRLVVYGGPERAPTVLFNEKVTARLGKGVAENGMLSAKASAAALAALRRFAAILRLRGIGQVDTVATAAVRDAANGRDFLAEVSALSLAPRLLSGEEEALTAAAGVAAAFPGARGVVGDLGGGSLELTHVDGELCEHGTTMPLGTLRLPQLRALGPEKFARRVHKLLLAADWRGCDGEDLYLVGGSCRAFARYAMHQQNWPIDDPHGHEMTVDEAQKVVRSLAHGKLVAGVPGLSSSRLAALPDTAALLGVLLRELRPARIVFSSWGLREGVLAGNMSETVRRQNPLLAGVEHFTAPTSRIDPQTIADWIRQPLGEHDDQADEVLRLAAIRLALASMDLEPNLRASTATDWALRKRWTGVSAKGRAMLAMAALANVGRTSTPDALLRIVPDGCLSKAAALGLAIRLARRFSGSAGAALDGASLRREHGRLILTASGSLVSLVADPVERDLRALAERLGLEPVVAT